MLLFTAKPSADDQGPHQIPRILYSRISPPIYVDSRIAARSKSSNKQAAVRLHLTQEGIEDENDLFDPDLLTKKFYKKVKGKGKLEQDILVDDSLQGLLHYLTAPNIRNKLRKLLFYIIRFPTCLKLFFPTTFLETSNVDPTNPEIPHYQDHI